MPSLLSFHSHKNTEAPSFLHTVAPHSYSQHQGLFSTWPLDWSTSSYVSSWTNVHQKIETYGWVLGIYSLDQAPKKTPKRFHEEKIDLWFVCLLFLAAEGALLCKSIIDRFFSLKGGDDSCLRRLKSSVMFLWSLEFFICVRERAVASIQR